MKKFFCLMLVLMMICLVGCGQEQKPTDPNQIPTEVATPQDPDKPTEEP